MHKTTSIFNRFLDIGLSNTQINPELNMGGPIEFLLKPKKD